MHKDRNYMHEALKKCILGCLFDLVMFDIQKTHPATSWSAGSWSWTLTLLFIFVIMLPFWISLLWTNTNCREVQWFNLYWTLCFWCFEIFITGSPTFLSTFLTRSFKSSILTLSYHEYRAFFFDMIDVLREMYFVSDLFNSTQWGSVHLHLMLFSLRHFTERIDTIFRFCLF